MARRTYATDQIEVHWDSGRCIHTGWCSKALIEVFNTEQRPWIRLEAGPLDEIVKVVENCPSGALTYTRLGEGPQEETQVPATIVPWPKGPYFVRGSFEVKDRHGEVFDTAPRATLCRCGASANHPFCDLSHRESGFSNYPRVSPPPGEAE
jgi:uncharacterized Fe-S cluster protein YjdI/CDGSH-type Zn-finger protein